MKKDRELDPDLTGPFVDELGRSKGLERAEVSSSKFVKKSAAILDVSVGGTRKPR